MFPVAWFCKFYFYLFPFYWTYVHQNKFIRNLSFVRARIFVCFLNVFNIPIVNRELPDIQASFRKHKGTRDQIANICWIIKKQKSSRKTSISALLTMPKPLPVWITINCRKFWKRWQYQASWPTSWEMCMQVKKQQLELTWNRLVPNRKRSTSRLNIVTLLI